VQACSRSHVAGLSEGSSTVTGVHYVLQISITSLYLPSTTCWSQNGQQRSGCAQQKETQDTCGSCWRSSRRCAATATPCRGRLAHHSSLMLTHII
jgi:hypothetical protein